MFIESFVCGQTCQQHMCGQEAVLICNIVDSQHTNVGTGLNSGPLGWTTGPETTAQFNKRLLRQCAASATLSTEAAIFTIHTYIHTHIHTYTHTHIQTCMHACMHTCIHAYMHTCIHAYMHTCIHSYIHTFMHSCIHAFMHSCINTFIHSCIHAFMHSYQHT